MNTSTSPASSDTEYWPVTILITTEPLSGYCRASQWVLQSLSVGTAEPLSGYCRTSQWVLQSLSVGTAEPLSGYCRASQWVLQSLSVGTAEPLSGYCRASQWVLGNMTIMLMKLLYTLTTEGLQCLVLGSEVCLQAPDYSALVSA